MYYVRTDKHARYGKDGMDGCIDNIIKISLIVFSLQKRVVKSESVVIE
jgi:hypothetical protein